LKKRHSGTATLLFLLIVWALGLAQERPPTEAGPFRQPDLVELVKLDPTLRLDIRYATRNNFLGRPVYKEARAFLQRPAAEALVRVNRVLREQGFGLVVFDGYRPWSVTKAFWDATPEEKKEFVADPRKGSRHNRGCAVDLTMFDLSTGQQVQMPSEYDEMTERSHINYECATPEAKRLRGILRSAMEAEGFKVYEPEWWHYDYKDWKEYPILNLSFKEIRKSRGQVSGVGGQGSGVRVGEKWFVFTNPRPLAPNTCFLDRRAREADAAVDACDRNRSAA
jgi:D-alanyl-D-alanine dipeptidase